MTFGDKRPASPIVEMPRPRKKGERVFLEHARDMPYIQTYRQTHGPMHLAKFEHDGAAISVIAPSCSAAVHKAEQFYMKNTLRGREDSKELEL